MSLANDSANKQSDHVKIVWSVRWSLTTRILAINIFAIAMLAAGFFYLDTYRTRLVDSRINTMEDQLVMLTSALQAARSDQRQKLITHFTQRTASRVRFYRSDGTLESDSFHGSEPAYRLHDPEAQPWYREAARRLDRAIDWIVGAPVPAFFSEPASDRAEAWPELLEARKSGQFTSHYRYAPDRTPLLSTAGPVQLDSDTAGPAQLDSDAAGPAQLDSDTAGPAQLDSDTAGPAQLDSDTAGPAQLDREKTILMTVNARDIIRTVRAERLKLGLVIAIVTLASGLLSLFFARTIVLPLRRLARSAVRVRLGRERDVVVPRLPSRRDEIGTLARALSDMTQTLRERIDAGELFAADVTHELKNPIASLRSTIEGLGSIRDKSQRKQLLAIAEKDVHRLDRLVSDINEASRVGAQLTRIHFEKIDVGQLIEAMLNDRAMRTVRADAVRIAFARPQKGSVLVYGDGLRLERAINNVIDNAVSFSQPGALVCVKAVRRGKTVEIRIDDEGPGVVSSQREAIFHRFHSDRPDAEALLHHSGLGLAITRSIIEGHHGSISVTDREDGVRGASFVILLPAAAGV